MIKNTFANFRRAELEPAPAGGLHAAHGTVHAVRQDAGVRGHAAQLLLGLRVHEPGKLSKLPSLNTKKMIGFPIKST